MRKLGIWCLSISMLAFACFYGAGAAFSRTRPDIALEQFSGNVLLTLPDDSRVELEPGLPVPEIPSGSTVEVITGSAVLDVLNVKISPAAGSAARIYNVRERMGRFNLKAVKGRTEFFIGLLRAVLEEDDEVIVRINPRTRRATIFVLAGEVVVEEDGVVTILRRNDSFDRVLPFFPEDRRPATPEPVEPERIEASPFML